MCTCTVLPHVTRVRQFHFAQTCLQLKARCTKCQTGLATGMLTVYPYNGCHWQHLQVVGPCTYREPHKSLVHHPLIFSGIARPFERNYKQYHRLPKSVFLKCTCKKFILHRTRIMALKNYCFHSFSHRASQHRAHVK